jgi:hypothetical protein
MRQAGAARVRCGITWAARDRRKYTKIMKRPGLPAVCEDSRQRNLYEGNPKSANELAVSNRGQDRM